MMTDIGEEAAVEVQPQIEHNERESTVDFSNAMKNLADGLLAVYQAPLQQIKGELYELTTKQETLISQMEVENKKLSDTQEDVELNELFSTVKIYQGKLATIKKEMMTIHERSFKLKKRALRLQQIKQKEALNREQQREQEIRKEQELIGKPSTT